MKCLPHVSTERTPMGTLSKLTRPKDLVYTVFYILFIRCFECPIEVLKYISSHFYRVLLPPITKQAASSTNSVEY